MRQLGPYYGMDQVERPQSRAAAAVFQTQTIFDLNGAILSTGPLASTTGKLIDPDIKPIYTTRILFGYATHRLKGVQPRRLFHVARCTTSWRTCRRGRPARRPTAGHSLRRTCRALPMRRARRPRAQRTYRALTVDVAAARQPVDERRELRGAGSKATSISTTPTSAVFNTSSFIQDGPGTNVEDPGRFRSRCSRTGRTCSGVQFLRRDQPDHRVRLLPRAERSAVGGAGPGLGRRDAPYLSPPAATAARCGRISI
jgi:hypothetical protein